MIGAGMQRVCVGGADNAGYADVFEQRRFDLLCSLIIALDNPCNFYFSSLIQTVTVGPGISPDQSFCKESRTITAGRELRPAPKKSAQRYALCLPYYTVNEILFVQVLKYFAMIMFDLALSDDTETRAWQMWWWRAEQYHC